MNPSTRCLTLCLALCGVGCASTWLPERFVPSPLEVRIGEDGEPHAAARALLAVRGIRRAKDSAPAQVEINLRLENIGLEPFSLAPEGFDLVTSDLVSFRAPRVDPPAGETVAPGEMRSYLLQFATPEGTAASDFDWSGINLRFELLLGERAIITSVTFERLYLIGPMPGYYYDPYWGPYPYGPYSGPAGARVGVGVSVSN